MYNPAQKSERQLKKDKEKLENRKSHLETKNEIKQYLGWQELPHLEKSKIRSEWNNYYNKCKETTSAKEFAIAKQALKDKNTAILKEIGNKAKKRIESQNWELSKPQGIDPWEFSHGIYNKYDFICNQIKNISKKLTGVEDVKDIFTSDKKAVIKGKQYKQPYMNY